MRFLLCIFITLSFISCTAQKKNNAGILKGKVDIGPLCPQEPCNPTPERLKQVYASYEIVVMDTSAQRILFKIPIESDASFNKKIAAGEYSIKIMPVTGNTFNYDPKRISVKKGKTTDVSLSYDTGLR